MEITNNILTWLILVAVGISIVGTSYSLSMLNGGGTGLVVSDISNVSGNASVLVSRQTVLRYTVAVIDFGSGSVNVTTNYCNLTLNGTGNVTINKSGCDGFSSNGHSLTLENAGSTDMNVTLNFNKNASTLLGGGSKYGIPPVFQYTVSNNESNSCASGIYPGDWMNVTGNVTTTICTNLSYIDDSDSIIIGIKMGIPVDATSGTKSVNIRAQGTSLE